MTMSQHVMDLRRDADNNVVDFFTCMRGLCAEIERRQLDEDTALCFLSDHVKGPLAKPLQNIRKLSVFICKLFETVLPDTAIATKFHAYPFRLKQYDNESSTSWAERVSGILSNVIDITLEQLWTIILNGSRPDYFDSVGTSMINKSVHPLHQRDVLASIDMRYQERKNYKNYQKNVKGYKPTGPAYENGNAKADKEKTDNKKERNYDCRVCGEAHPWGKHPVRKDHKCEYAKCGKLGHRKQGCPIYKKDLAEGKVVGNVVDPKYLALDKPFCFFEGPELNKSVREPLVVCIDTGSPANLLKMSEAVNRHLVLEACSAEDTSTLVSATGHGITCTHKTTVNVLVDLNKTVPVTFLVSNDISENILSFSSFSKSCKNTYVGSDDEGAILVIDGKKWIRLCGSSVYSREVITTEQLKLLLSYNLKVGEEVPEGIEDQWELLSMILQKIFTQNTVNAVGITAPTSPSELPTTLSKTPRAGLTSPTSEDWRKTVRVPLTTTQETLLAEKLMPQLLSLNKEFPSRKQRNGVEFEIKINEKDHFKQKMRPLKSNQRDFFRDIVTKLLLANLIFVVAGGQALCVSNATFPTKPDGSLRFCVDYRQLNTITITDRSHIPSVQEVLDTMQHDARVFICLDLRSAFWHVPIREQDRLKTCFYGPDGQILAWNVCPFGAKNSPAVYNRFMRAIFEDVPGVSVYVDDLLIQGKDVDQLFERFARVVELLKENDIAINIKKFQMGESVEILGMVRDSKGLHPNPKKVEALRQVGTPKDASELARVLGMIKYLSNLVPNVGVDLASLYRKTSSKVKWKWEPEDQQILNQVIDRISDKLTIYLPDPSKQFALRIDASNDGVGGYLFQFAEKHSKEERPMLFFSKAFSETQRKWAAVEKEAYAIVYAISRCSRYLEGPKFQIYTDHKPLLWMLNSSWKGPERAKIYRWLLLLMQYDFELIHTPGKLNIVADALSRTPYAPKEALMQSVDHIDGPVPLPTTDSDFKEDAFELLCRAKLEGKPVPTHLLGPSFDPVRREVEIYSKHLQLISGRLCFKDDSDSQKVNYGHRLYVPVRDRAQVLFSSHSSSMAGHGGVDITLKRLKQAVWWPHMNKDVREFVKFCDVCQKFKDRDVLNEELHPIDRASCFERVHLDLIGPLPRSSDGNVHIVHVVDSATKFTVAVAVPNKEAETIARAIVQEVILRYGVPASIVTDQARELTGKLNQELCLLLGIARRTTSPYHPAANGQVERKNGILMGILRMLTNEEQSDWDQMLPYAVFAMNTATPRGLTHSPFFLMHGRNPRTLLDQSIDAVPVVLTKYDWWNNLIRARELSSESEGLSRYNNKKYFDAKIKQHKFSVGDRVLVRFTSPGAGKTLKLSAPQDGPYVITKLDQGCAVVQHATEPQTLVRHVDRLVPYYENVPITPTQDDFEQEIESIVDEKIVEGTKLFLVHWRGLNQTRDMWLSEEEIRIAKEVELDWKKRSQPLQLHSPHKLVVVRHPHNSPLKLASKSTSNKTRKHTNTIYAYEIVDHRQKPGRRGGLQLRVATDEDLHIRDYTWLDECKIENQESVKQYKQQKHLV